MDALPLDAQVGAVKAHGRTRLPSQRGSSDRRVTKRAAQDGDSTALSLGAAANLK